MVSPTFSFGGIASGLDTGRIIEQLVALEWQPIRALETQQQQLRRVDGAWSTLATKLSSVRAALDDLRRPGSLQALTTATSSSPDAVAVTGGSGGTAGAMSFRVAALAERHRVAFDARFGSAAAVVGAGELTITDATGGVLGSVRTDGSETLDALAARIGTLEIGVQARVVKVSASEHQLVLSSSRTGEGSRFTVSSTSASLDATSVLSTGRDAQLELGALRITRPTNTISDLVNGAVVELKRTTTEDVTVTVARDTEAVLGRVRRLVTTANDLLSQIATDSRYDPDTRTAGILQGEPLTRELAFGLRQALTRVVPGGSVTYGSQVGLSLTRGGRVALDEAALRSALDRDPSGVESFLSASLAGASGVTLGAATRGTTERVFAMTVSRVATVAEVVTPSFTDAGPARELGLTTPAGRTLTVRLDAGMDAAGVVSRVRSALEAAGDTSMTVGLVGGDAVRLASTAPGSARRVTVEGWGDADVDRTAVGTDVVATFTDADGVTTAEVVGTGRSISGTGPAAGLTMTVTAGAARYDLRFSGGLTGVVDDFVRRVEGPEGRLQQRRDTIASQIRGVDRRIDAHEVRVGLREATLRQQFTGLETALSRMQSQSRWLAGALVGTYRS